MTPDFPYLLRPVTPDDRSDLVAMHRAVYAGDGGGLNPIDAKVWDWRYGAGGNGNVSSVAESREHGDLVAFIGGIPRRIWTRIEVAEGEVTDGIQSLDLMTTPSDRYGLTGIGVFARLLEHWCDVRFSADGAWFAFGFPTTPAFRLGRKFGGYRLFGPVNVLVCSSPHRLATLGDSLTARVVDEVPPDLDELWLRAAAGIELGIVRDAEYFTWRYARHPRFAYRLVELRDRESNLRGFLVTRRGGIAEDVTMMMDWLAPLDDDEARGGILAAAAEAAKATGTAALVAWVRENRPWFKGLQDLGFRLRETPIIHVGRSWRSAASVEVIRRTLCASLGDIEYY